MTMSLRLDKELARQLDAVARVRGVSRSEVVRQCLEEYLSREQQRPTGWELGKSLFGRTGSGRRDLARDRKRIVRESVHAKARRR